MPSEVCILNISQSLSVKGGFSRVALQGVVTTKHRICLCMRTLRCYKGPMGGLFFWQT